MPIGGDHFTNDVAVGFRTPLPDAEKIKKMFGCAIVTRIPEGNEIEVPSVGDRPSRLMQQRMLGEILEPRARELIEMMRDHLRQAGVYRVVGAGVVFTGGGVAVERRCGDRRKTCCAGRCAWVIRCRLPSCRRNLLEPEFSTAIGMVLYGHRARQARGNSERGFRSEAQGLFARQNV